MPSDLQRENSVFILAYTHIRTKERPNKSRLCMVKLSDLTSQTSYRRAVVKKVTRIPFDLEDISQPHDFLAVRRLSVIRRRLRIGEEGDCDGRPYSTPHSQAFSQHFYHIPVCINIVRLVAKVDIISLMHAQGKIQALATSCIPFLSLTT